MMDLQIYGIAMKRNIASLLTIFLVTVAGYASAQGWAGVKSGAISGIDVTSGQNFGLRVYMDGSPMCGEGSAAWAFANKDFDNYDALASLLTSAYMPGKQVGIYTTREGPYCRIGYAIFR